MWHQQAPIGSEAHPTRLAAGPVGVVATGSIGEGPASWFAVGRRDPFCQIDCQLDPSRSYAWTSTDGREWRCDTSGKRMNGFVPSAVAASDAIEVAVGTTNAGYDEESGLGIPGDAWSRALR